MYCSTARALSLLLSTAALTSAANVGDMGKLSSLEGGFEGVATVASETEIIIVNYELADASAPALYFWASQSSQLNTGFRVSNMHITTPTMKPTNLTVTLDAGHTAADFLYFGLYCEQFKLEFGQTELEPASGGSMASPSSGMMMANASSTAAHAPAAATTSAMMKSAGSINSVGSAVTAVAGAIGFALAMW